MSQPSASFGHEFMGSQGSKASLKINSKTSPSDKHVAVYDASNSVSLSSVMQSNVPKPFETKGTDAPPHLGMPGGQWSQGDKYVSGDLHDHHHNNSKSCLKRNPGMGYSRLLYVSKKHSIGSGIFSLPATNHRAFSTTSVKCVDSYSCLTSGSRCSLTGDLNSLHFPCINYMNAWCDISLRRPSAGLLGKCFIHTSSASKDESDDGRAPNITQRQKLKRAVKDYGATVVVFHITISLASLGFFYILVSSGIDMSGLIERLGINLTTLEQNSLDLPSTTATDLTPSSEESDFKKPDEGGRRKVQAVAAGVSTFVLSYAIHKVFAPVRIAITLSATPFIVRHLRKIGVLKPPKMV
ncbi:UNVERIFIED_CONTAM: hypothetical protein RMT77_014572 [Armadillidium vulgare]